MIDTRRWVLVEAWLSLGLRIEWHTTYGRQPSGNDWLTDNETGGRFRYAGHGRWEVVDDDRRFAGAPRPTAPQLGVETMRHELAHYLMASDEERGQTNFGMTPDSVEAEERALVAQKVIDAVLTGANRIAELALLGGRRG